MGGRKKTVSDAEILQYFRDADDPFLATSEVQEELGFSNSGTISRLTELADHGYLNRKEAGKAKIWWLSKSGEEFLNEATDEDFEAEGKY